jgi:glycosyltransferase involved in cell wall biosynthesis
MLLSAIVPTWCEAGRIELLVASLLCETDEVVVVDARSPDGTAALAARSGARVILAPRGRGGQLDEGVRGAQGESFVFVHADTTIPRGFGAAIRAALADPAVVGGNFRLRFEPETPTAKLFTLANDLRRRALRIYYGDSCIFVRRSIFEALGGFSGLPLFEDHHFAQRLEACGPTRYLTDLEVGSSGRRFEGRALRTLAVWGTLHLAFTLGAPPALLARLYESPRRPHAHSP